MSEKKYISTAQIGSPSVLVCFAVKEEAKFFLPRLTFRDCSSLITGMGRNNAAQSIRDFFSLQKPELLITSGFAGGLNPNLKVGTVVFDEDYEVGLTAKLLELKAVPGTFYCAKRVAVTAAEKKALHESTKADAVEMESSVIRTICREQGVLSATIRVISDAATDDLPLDFNAIMTSSDRINYRKLMWQLLGHPQKIPSLMRFQEQTVSAARELADVLHKSLRKPRGG